jgi:ABC-type transport system involved in cytochrome bd biosynthesis fused ATPase/permease subunit
MKELFEKTWVRHLLVVLAILIIWQVGAFALRYMARTNGEQILAPVAKNSTVEIQGMKTLSTLEKSNLQRLLNLFARVESQKEQHKEAFLIFYPYHFTSSALLLILSSISVVMLFLTAQVGLNNTSPYVRTIFFTLAALTSFYALSPLVFQQETNISTNLSKYILYDNLEGEIYNYAVTNPNVTSSNDTLSFNKFHSLITKTMSDINSINVEFDYKVIPVPDYGLTKK